MSNNVKLKDLYLGTPDGAVEARNKKFEELFFDPNNKYKELITNDEKFLVLGSKGTGKTYLAKYVLSKSPKSQNAELIEATDFWIYKLSNIDDEELSDEINYALCKWFILDKIAHMLIKNHRHKCKYLKFTAVGRLKKIADQYNNESFFKETKLIVSSAKERNISSSFGAKTDIKDVNAETNRASSNKISKGTTIEAERKRFFEMIEKYEQLLFDSFSRKDDILLIFDDLDELKKKTGDNSEDIIANLIKIAKEYNLQSEKCSGKLKIIMLLRSDILSKMQGKYANLNKIKTSCAVELYWLFDSMSEKYEHPLIKMILRKMQISCEQYKDYSYKQLFQKLFPENIDGKNALDYLLDYSLGRPRDIVVFLNHAKNEFPDSEYFTAHALKEVKKLYSSDFYDEMLNQASFYKKSDYSRQCLKLIGSIKKNSFHYEDIEKNFTENRDQYNEIEDLDEAIAFLYELGAIGNVWKVRKDKVHTCWSYKKDAMDEVDLSKKFTIHYGLRKKFSL